jgi:hypothetical protein
MVGGMTERSRVKQLEMTCNALAAPIAWPIIDLMELVGTE